MSQIQLEPPFIWPDPRSLGGCKVSIASLSSLLSDSQLILGSVHGLTEDHVNDLCDVLMQKSEPGGNGHVLLPGIYRQTVRLVVTVYPACPTTENTLMKLLQLQESHEGVSIRIAACELLDQKQNIVAYYRRPEDVPLLLVGTGTGFTDLIPDRNHCTAVFKVEPVLASSWANWFDYRWAKAVPLTSSRTTIPRLVLPKRTEQAARLWDAYENALHRDAAEDLAGVTVEVDPSTGQVTAKNADGENVSTPSSEAGLPRLTPVYGKLASLFEKGHLVSIDKHTRLQPLEVPVKPKWFGLETLRQIGKVKRQVSYKISLLTKEELKDLENRRKKMSELLDAFTFSLADGQRWMPTSAQSLFHGEITRVNGEAKEILADLIADDLKGFLDSRRDGVFDDANRMYGDLFPGKVIAKEALNEIMDTFRSRLEKAQQRSFLPQVSFTKVSLPLPHEAAWTSDLGSAFHLLLSIIRYPRKACLNGPYFGRGLEARPDQILESMNVLSDPFINRFQDHGARGVAEADLQTCEEIADSDMPTPDKCERLFQLLDCGEDKGRSTSVE